MCHSPPLQTRYLRNKSHEVATRRSLAEAVRNLVQQPSELWVSCAEPGPQGDSLPLDCWDLRQEGHNTSGVYRIKLRGAQKPLLVYCDMETDGGGWTVR